jgi:hypothetical protein
MPSPPVSNRTILIWIMLALAAWGIFHAFGAWLLNYDVRRPLIVIGCMAAFLAFWGLLLWTRHRKLR